MQSIECGICYEDRKIDDCRPMECCLKHICELCYEKIYGQNCPFCRRPAILKRTYSSGIEMFVRLRLTGPPNIWSINVELDDTIHQIKEKALNKMKIGINPDHFFIVLERRGIRLDEKKYIIDYFPENRDQLIIYPKTFPHE